MFGRRMKMRKVFKNDSSAYRSHDGLFRRLTSWVPALPSAFFRALGLGLRNSSALCLRDTRASSCWRLRLGLLLRQHQFRWQLEHLGAHLLARLELHHGPLWDGHIGIRGVRIAPDSRFAHFDLEDSEVAQFHIVPFGQGFANVV